MENGANNMRLSSYDGAWYTERNGNTFVTISRIFSEWGQFFIRHDNNWQTIVLICFVQHLQAAYNLWTISVFRHEVDLTYLSDLSLAVDRANCLSDVFWYDPILVI